MRLWILRHGEAERQTLRDAERNLTPRGEIDARNAGNYLLKSAPSLRILASPYRRAQQTAQCVLSSMPGRSLNTVDWLTPDYDPLAVVAELSKAYGTELKSGDTNILLVSHQPLVSALIGLLVDGDYRTGPAMDTASLAELDLSIMASACATLRSLRHAPNYVAAAI